MTTRETIIEATERELVADWHEDQCACQDFDGKDIETCYTRKNGSPFFYPPITWTTDAVIDKALDPIKAALAEHLRNAKISRGAVGVATYNSGIEFAARLIEGWTP